MQTKHIQSCTAHGEISQIQEVQIHHTKVNDQHSPEANKLVVTPVRVTVLGQFLEEYDTHLRIFLCSWFQQGYKIQYQGRIHQCYCNHLLSVEQHEIQLQKNIQKENSLNEIAFLLVPLFLIFNDRLLALCPKKKLMSLGCLIQMESL